jgi:hypothetical protein
MKTKDLIELLQQADPSGEEHVCVGNTDIFSVITFPAYYDGKQEILIRDESKKEGYNVVGGMIRGSGVKIQIQTLSIQEAAFDSLVEKEDFPVIFEGVSEDSKQRWINDFEEWKKSAIQVVQQVRDAT